MWNKFLDDFVESALHEDIGEGDFTSQACIPESRIGTANLIVKQQGILAGVFVAKKVFTKLDPDVTLNVFLDDGAKVSDGSIAFAVTGKVLYLLQAERLVLNIMQRMSGIATKTHRYVKELEGLKTRILDTRKTTPGMRLLDKQAVRIGGGKNHRVGLFDMIMIKDNHIDFAGGIEQAIHKTHDYLNKIGKKLDIEIEARSIADVNEILKVGKIDRIMLDNFSVEQTRLAVNIIEHKYEVESSGGITLKNIREYAECGVDFISVGALTHQIKSLDMSLKAVDF
ncbi:MAG: carboxylating nicotinate-nucleotide diphosphorylase [Bacteroidales bacterium]|nr:carboxylating nicotinate-nucleotide diphosphorylase [Bacteroidales bacterium]